MNVYQFFKTIILLFLTGLSCNVLGQSCLSIENVKLGCVSSHDKKCTMPKGLNQYGRVGCTYVTDYSTQIKRDLPLGMVKFQCVTYVTQRTCIPKPEGGQDCKEEQICTKYAEPKCDEVCTGCWRRAVTAEVGIWARCVLCHRLECPDERDAKTNVCPMIHEGLRERSYWSAAYDLCAAAQPCPSSATDELGVTHNVAITRGACPPPPRPIDREPNIAFCPWKADKRTGGWKDPKDPSVGSAGNCEPIEDDNRFEPPADLLELLRQFKSSK